MKLQGARRLAWVASAGLHAAAAGALLHGLPREAEAVLPVMLLEMPAPAAPAEPTPEPVAEPPAPVLAEAPPEPAPPPEPPPPPLAEAPPEPVPEPPQAMAPPEPPPPEPPPPVEEVAELPLPPPPPPPQPVPRPVAPPRRPQPPRPVVPSMAEASPAAPSPAAPSPAPTPAPVSAAPSPNYASLLMQALERHRRYPEEARWRRAQGVALLRFRMRRDGTVVGYRIERSAGDAALDQAVQTMIQQASPLPAPPADLAGDPVELTVPVRFTLR
ncbi:energy transducer TonB [Belnapia sp. T6]|uniref:Energy transducer TonB n=1 Tax=Belnapia mucosa TaxID=2804532 RepID=A0ABS1V507_9PROT|nr:TonB family protein [Belnapia mucosa]MBL6456793.1 energy transducer TonB [Belnapia mucosa]